MSSILAAGISLPEVTVEYNNINVEADALVGSASIPSLSNVALGICKVCVWLPAPKVLALTAAFLTSCCQAYKAKANLHNSCPAACCGSGWSQDKQAECLEECVRCPETGKEVLPSHL